MIIAGAGTGKTTVLTRRIAWLIEEKGIDQQNILALTFTNKAAAEMEKKLDQILSYGQTQVEIGTFHHFCQKLLERFPIQAEINQDTHLLTENEQLLFIKNIILDFPAVLRPSSNPTIHLRLLANFFDRCKDSLISPEQLKKDPGIDPATDLSYSDLADAFGIYQTKLKERNFLDYGELLFRTWQVLSKSPMVKKEIAEQYRYCLVDEYQDTNFSQTAILKLIAGDGTNLTVVGDDDQAIYRFRGAAVGQMSDFIKTYPRVSIVTLRDNFRSPQHILDLAYRLIQHNNPYRLEAELKIDKKLKSWRKNNGRQIEPHVFPTESKEAEWVVDDIIAHIKQGNQPGDMAILIRSNRQGQIFRHFLEKRGLDYSAGDLGAFLNDPAIKLTINFLKTVADPLDILSFFALATSELYRLPISEVTAAISESKKTHQPPEEYLKPDTSKGLINDLNEYREQLTNDSTHQLLLNWTKKKSVQKILLTVSQDNDNLERVINLLFNLVDKFEQTNQDRGVLNFLDNLSTLTDDENLDNQSDTLIDAKIKLITIHSAKGLEFPVVYLTNLTKDRFPTVDRSATISLPETLQHLSEPEGESLREERRLCYVAFTRAKNELILTRSLTYGGQIARKPSIFLSEIESEKNAVIANEEKNEEKIEKNHDKNEQSDDGLKNTNTKKITLSSHSLTDYLDCPLKYRYHYLDHIPTTENHQLLVGIAVHQLIADYFRFRQNKKTLTEDELCQNLQQLWPKRGFLSKEHRAERFSDIQNQLRLFKSVFDRWPEPEAIEKNFSVDIGSITLNGRLDVVFKKNEQGIPGTYILDFKTTSAPKNIDNQAKTSLQLSCYAYAYNNISKQNPTVGLYFTDGGQFAWTTKSQRQMSNLENKIIKAANQITENDFEATPNRFICQNCPFNSFCLYSEA